MRSLLTVVIVPTPFAKTPRAAAWRGAGSFTAYAGHEARPEGHHTLVTDGTRRHKGLRETRASHLITGIRKMSDAWANRHHPRDAPRRSPSLAADETAARRSRRVTKKGIAPQHLTAPGHMASGPCGIRHRAGTARHFPAFGNACECQSPLRKGAVAASGRLRAQQDRLDLSFPAVQGCSIGQ